MKKLKPITLIFAFTLCSLGTLAQENHLSSKKGETSIGLGLGLPYGALGGRFGINIIDNLNLFAGVGYQIAGVGYNFGLLKDFKSNSSTQFYLVGMYGTNAAIKVDGLSEYDELYLGPTLGLGIKINSRKTEGNYWDIGLLVPFQSNSFEDDKNIVENDPRVSEFTDAWPVLIVLGYNFNL